MLLAFETSRYGEIFHRARALAIQGGHVDKHPGHDHFIADWKLLLTSLLEWWAWMKQPHIDRRCVKRSVYVTSFLLRRLREVAPRHDGMKNNTVKTHLVLHMLEDIKDLGVPEIFNSAVCRIGTHPNHQEDRQEQAEAQQNIYNPSRPLLRGELGHLTCLSTDIQQREWHQWGR
jgi:hypothetical protein